jgi:hypothetical protein
VPTPVQATSKDPRTAARQEEVVHGVRWGLSYEAALARAAAEGRPVLVHFAGVHDAHSRRMERTVLPRREVVARLARFVTVRLDVDIVPIGSLTRDEREALAEANLGRERDLAGSVATPCFLVVDPVGQVLAVLRGDTGTAAFVGFLDGALAEARPRPRGKPTP